MEVEGQLNEMKSDVSKKKEKKKVLHRKSEKERTGEGARQKLLERRKAQNIHTEGFF